MFLILLLGLVFEHPALQLDINGPTSPVEAGKNIRLSITIPEKTNTLVSTAYIWIVDPPVDDLDEWPDHSHICFGSGTQPTKFNITVIGSFIFQSADKSIVQSFIRKQITVTVGTPTPTLPDGKYKLAQYIYNLAGKMPLDQSASLANSLSSIAKQARDGKFATKAAMIQVTKDADTQALGANLLAWKTILDALAIKMNSLKSVLVTPQDVAIAYDELSQGLMTIGKSNFN